MIVTKDDDFALWRMAHPRQTPQVVWLRIGNTRRSELLQGMKQLLPQGVDGSAVLGCRTLRAEREHGKLAQSDPFRAGERLLITA